MVRTVAVTGPLPRSEAWVAAENRVLDTAEHFNQRVWQYMRPRDRPFLRKACQEQRFGQEQGGGGGGSTAFWECRNGKSPISVAIFRGSAG